MRDLYCQAAQQGHGAQRQLMGGHSWKLILELAGSQAITVLMNTGDVQDQQQGSGGTMTSQDNKWILHKLQDFRGSL